MKHGKDIIVYLNGTAIASTRSNDIGSSCELIETASRSDGSSRHYTAGLKEWDVTTSFLVASDSALLSALLAVGTTYTIVIGPAGQSSITTGVTGSAILQTCRITATKGNLVQGSFSFKGTGPLESL